MADERIPRSYFLSAGAGAVAAVATLWVASLIGLDIFPVVRMQMFATSRCKAGEGEKGISLRGQPLVVFRGVAGRGGAWGNWIRGTVLAFSGTRSDTALLCGQPFTGVRV